MQTARIAAAREFGIGTAEQILDKLRIRLESLFSCAFALRLIISRSGDPRYMSEEEAFVIGTGGGPGSLFHLISSAVELADALGDFCQVKPRPVEIGKRRNDRLEVIACFALQRLPQRAGGPTAIVVQAPLGRV